MSAFNKSVFLVSILSLLIWSSCQVEKVKTVTETVKSISGSWEIVNATQNGINITSNNGLNFTQFRINFQANSYTLANPLPFIVYQNGSYSLNDPQVPTEITFTPSGGQAITSTFIYPIVTGVRNIKLQFTANQGCTNNTYVYTLQKVN
jgi:hypothetical protein